MMETIDETLSKFERKSTWTSCVETPCMGGGNLWITSAVDVTDVDDDGFDYELRDLEFTCMHSCGI
jgi:hypothetical protein